MDPKQYRGLRRRQAIPSRSYYKILEANKKCLNALVIAGRKNKQAAEHNRPDSFSKNLEDAGWGAMALLLLEVLVYIALL